MVDQEDTEEDFRERVVAYLDGLGVSAAHLRHEHVVRLRLGRHAIELNTPGRPFTLLGRYDLLLVNDAGKNVLLAELKRTRETLTPDDRDQAVSYARLQDQMPPLVLLSNGLETRIYDVASLEEITGAGVATAWSTSVSGQMRVSADDLRLREEALRLFIGYSEHNVRLFCLAQQRQRMEALRGSSGDRNKKYLPAVYVPRASVREAFEAFLASSSPAFVLAGPSGAGKTNEMCALAEEASGSHLSLFFSGSELHDSPAHVMAEEFSWEFSDQLQLPRVCGRLASLVAGSARRVVIFLDAVDECSVAMIEQSVSAMTFHFARYQGALKVVVSVKDTQWERFAHFGDGESYLARHCFRPGLPDLSTAGPEAKALPSFALDLLMATSELAVAIEKYTAHFGIRGEIRRDTLGLARDPFVLRVLSEVCADGALDPSALSHDQTPLLRRYLDQKRAKVAPAARAGLLAAIEAVGRALVEAAGTANSAEVHEVPERAALAHAPAGWPELPSTAFDAGLLTRERDAAGRTSVRFQYDRIRDYVVAFHVLRLDTWTREALDAEADGLLQHALGQAALLTYLDTCSDQEHALVGTAHRRATRFLEAYDSFRMGLGPLLRSRVSPRTSGAIGLVYSFHGHRRWTYGFFARSSEEPLVVARPDYAREWERLLYRRGDRAVPLTFGVCSLSAWPMLLDPEQCATTVALQEVREAVGAAGLDEASHLLDAEKVLAIAGRNRRELELPSLPGPHSEAAAELSTDLLPLDVDLLLRRVHAALGARQANAEALRRGADRSAVLLAMAEARQEAASGKRFDGRWATVSPVPTIAVLAEALARLRPTAAVLEQHHLPLPDLEGPAAGIALEVFEWAYSDDRLGDLVAQLHVLQLDEYMRVVETNLPLLSHHLQTFASLPHHLIAFYERATAPHRIGLDGSVLFARLAPDAPFPLSPGARLASGRAGRIQVFPRSTERPDVLRKDGKLHLSVAGQVIRLPNGCRETSLSDFMGWRTTPVPLGWRGERTSHFTPLRNSIYSRLIKDLKALDGAALVAHEGHGRR